MLSCRGSFTASGHAIYVDIDKLHSDAYSAATWAFNCIGTCIIAVTALNSKGCSASRQDCAFSGA